MVAFLHVSVDGMRISVFGSSGAFLEGRGIYHEGIVVLPVPYRVTIVLGIESVFARSAVARSTEEGNLLELHPTVKPVALVADAVMDCSARGDIVLDPFLGSGTTLIAAERTGRVCYGMELDPAYVDTITRRWQRFTGKEAVGQDGQAFTQREQEVENVGR